MRAFSHSPADRWISAPGSGARTGSKNTKLPSDEKTCLLMSYSHCYGRMLNEQGKKNPLQKKKKKILLLSTFSPLQCISFCLFFCFVVGVYEGESSHSAHARSLTDDRHSNPLYPARARTPRGSYRLNSSRSFGAHLKTLEVGSPRMIGTRIVQSAHHTLHYITCNEQWGRKWDFFYGCR